MAGVESTKRKENSTLADNYSVLNSTAKKLSFHSPTVKER